IDLHTIDKVYKAKYGIYLSDDVKRIYYGEYADALLKLLKKRRNPRYISTFNTITSITSRD
ncbi:unnamed protein product, partial [Schistosoma rodhaini]